MSTLQILQSTPALHEARWWEPEANNRVHCYLCPRHCHIGHGQSGFCYIRANQNGKLYSLGYASPAALQVDPIEKKPLNHFLPGTRIFSMGTAGCNMGCFFCQNWDISKSHQDQVHSQAPSSRRRSACWPANTAANPSRLPITSRRSGANTLSIFAKQPNLSGLKTVMVSQWLHYPRSLSRYLRPYRRRQHRPESIH